MDVTAFQDAPGADPDRGGSGVLYLDLGCNRLDGLWVPRRPYRGSSVDGALPFRYHLAITCWTTAARVRRGARDMTQTEIYRSMKPAERLAASFALHDFAHERLRVHLRRLYPEKAEREMLLEVARRLLGDAARVL